MKHREALRLMQTVGAVCGSGLRMAPDAGAASEVLWQDQASA